MKLVVDWLQLAASLAVLVGLGLVVLELRQARAIAQSEMVSESFAIGAENVSAVMGESPARALARACLEPAALTPDELIVVSFYYSHRIALVRRFASITRATELYPDENWQLYARSNVLPEVFSSEVGRAWWRTHAPYKGDETLKAIGDELLAELGPPTCGDDLRAMAALLDRG